MKKYYCFYCQKYVKFYRMFWWRVCANCHHYMVDDGNGFYKVCDKCKAKLPTDAAVCLKCGYHFSNRYAKNTYKFETCKKPNLRYLSHIFVALAYLLLIVGAYDIAADAIRYFTNTNRIIVHFDVKNNMAIIAPKDEAVLAEKIKEFQQTETKKLYLRIRAYTLPNNKMTGIGCADAMQNYLAKKVFNSHHLDYPAWELSLHISYDVCEYMPILYPQKGKNCRNADDYTYLIKGDSNLYLKSASHTNDVISVSDKCVVTVGQIDKPK